MNVTNPGYTLFHVKIVRNGAAVEADYCPRTDVDLPEGKQGVVKDLMKHVKHLLTSQSSFPSFPLWELVNQHGPSMGLILIYHYLRVEVGEPF